MSLIGKRAKRPEDPRLVAGRGRYVDDHSLPRMAYVAFVRSPHASARIAGIDLAAALAVPGVVGALTGAEPWLPGLLQAIAADGYFSLNAFFRPGLHTRTVEEYRPALIEGKSVEVLTETRRVQRVIPNSNGLLYAYREARGARWLTTAWVDCDGYTVGLDAPATLAGIMRAYREGSIPVPSFMMGSGRGAWAFFMLVDERNPVLLLLFSYFLFCCFLFLYSIVFRSVVFYSLSFIPYSLLEPAGFYIIYNANDHL